MAPGGRSIAGPGGVPSTPVGGPPTPGGLDLAARRAALAGLEWAYRAGEAAGVMALLVGGGFVPVLGAWLRDDLGGWSGVVRALGGVRAEAPSSDPDADLGPTLGRPDAPGLFDDVAAMARRLGVRPPGQVRLTYLPCCGVVAWGRSRALMIGLPLIAALNRAELRAILAHELAHLARGDATRSARTARFVGGLGLALDDPGPTRGRGPLRAWAAACRRLAEALDGPISRGQEARADRAAAAIVGGATTAAALVKAALVQPLFREVLGHYDPAAAAPENLYAFFREFWARLPESVQTAIRHQLMADGESAPAGAEHPPLLDRLAIVQSYPERPRSAADLAPARSLLADPESIEQMLHNRLFGASAVEPSVYHRAGS